MPIESFTPASLNEGFVVAVTLEAKPGEADRVAGLIEDLIAPTMAEPGVKLFLPYRSPTSPELFFIFELYVDEAAWGAHQASAHFRQKIPELLPHLARRERIPFTPYIATTD